MTIDVDANEVAYKFLNTAIFPVGGVYGLSCVISKLGIDVNIIGDPVLFCYNTKRASILRIG